MERFEFSIIASGLDPNADDFEARFYEGGCDDATVSFQKGHIIIDFAREAASIEEAIASAVESVRALGCHDMSEIPEDVMKAAWEANEKARVISPRDRQATIIARALLAERERCAKIVETMLVFADTTSRADKAIAAAIRAPRTDGEAQ